MSVYSFVFSLCIVHPLGNQVFMTTVGTFCLPHKYFSGDANLCMLHSNAINITVRKESGITDRFLGENPRSKK